MILHPKINNLQLRYPLVLYSFHLNTLDLFFLTVLAVHLFLKFEILVALKVVKISPVVH